MLPQREVLQHVLQDAKVLLGGEEEGGGRDRGREGEKEGEREGGREEGGRREGGRGEGGRGGGGINAHFSGPKHSMYVHTCWLS